MEFLSNLPGTPALAEADLQGATLGTCYKASKIEVHQQAEGDENRVENWVRYGATNR